MQCNAMQCNACLQERLSLFIVQHLRQSAVHKAQNVLVSTCCRNYASCPTSKLHEDDCCQNMLHKYNDMHNLAAAVFLSSPLAVVNLVIFALKRNKPSNKSHLDSGGEHCCWACCCTLCSQIATRHATALRSMLSCCSSRFSQHSTFEVDRSHPPQLARSSFSDAPDSARVSETGTGKAADGAEKSKRKGRFQIVEEDPTDPGKRGVGRSTSVANMDSHRSSQVTFILYMLTTVLHLGMHHMGSHTNSHEVDRPTLRNSGPWFPKWHQCN